WRWMLGFEIPFALLWFILVSLVPESPRWLMSVGREDDARKAMANLVSADSIEQEIESIKSNINSEKGLSLKEQFAALFSPLARKALIIGLLFAAVQPATGINAIYTYAPMIFELMGSDSPLWQTIWLGVVSLVANVFAFFLVDRLGRRPVVVIGLLWCALSLGLCAWGFNQATYSWDDESIEKISLKLGSKASGSIEVLQQQKDVVYEDDLSFITAMKEKLGDDFVNDNRNQLLGKAANINAGLILLGILSFIASFQFSIGPVMWVVLSEIFSNKIRGLAIPAAQLVAASVSTLVSLFFPWQISNTGLQSVFLVYCAPVVLGLIVFWSLLPETKNKSIEEIESMLTGNKPN
ncbi:MAG: MFS transporter, partial [Planctomycetota bacterium]